MNGKIKEAFSDVHASESLKQATFRALTQQKKRRKLSMAYRLAPVLAACLLLFVGVAYASPTAHISIDINPSIVLDVNLFNRVIGVTASNEDAKAIVESVSLHNLTYVEAMERLDEADSFAPYADSYTEITVVSGSETTSAQMVDRIATCSFSEGDNVSCYTVTQQQKDEAAVYDLSFGKYRAYLELAAVDTTVDIEAVKELSMRQLRDLIEQQGIDPETVMGNGNQTGTGQQEGGGNSQGNGAADGTGNGAADGTGNGVADGTGNGAADGTGNGAADGTGNGAGNGQGNGNGKPS